MNTQNLFIISGPSGAGEDSIINELSKKLPVCRSITTTTRDMRSGEKEGEPYYFVPVSEFKSLIEAGKLAEWDYHNKNYYGITHDELSRISSNTCIGLWKVDYAGVISAKKLFPEIISIFISVESLDVLEHRIRNRSSMSDDLINERLEYAQKWFDNQDIFDYTIVNKQGKLSEAVDEVYTILVSHSSLPH